MFGFQFFFNQKYEQEMGSGKKATILFIFIGHLVGAAILFAVNGFKPEFTVFTFIIALITMLNNMLYTVCSLKSLGRINLSLFSLFCMLGGMALPFCAGILFFKEDLTLGKSICLISIVIALLLTVERSSAKGGIIYYIGIFIFNGMSGVISKTFQYLPYEKTSDAGYSVLSAAITALVSGIALLFMLREKDRKLTLKAVVWTGCYGIINKVANLLLLITLVHLPASAQYPMITGGVMIVSTIISYFTPQKPKKREVIAVILSFAGIMALIMLP